MKLETRKTRSPHTVEFRTIRHALGQTYCLTVFGRESRVIVRDGFQFSRREIASALVHGLFIRF